MSSSFVSSNRCLAVSSSAKAEFVIVVTLIEDLISNAFLSSSSSFDIRASAAVFAPSSSLICRLSFAFTSSIWSRLRCSSNAASFAARFAASIAASSARFDLMRSLSDLLLRSRKFSSICALRSFNSCPNAAVFSRSVLSHSSCRASDASNLSRLVWQSSQDLRSLRRESSACKARMRQLSSTSSPPATSFSPLRNKANGSTRKLTPNGLSTRLISGLEFLVSPKLSSSWLRAPNSRVSVLSESSFSAGGAGGVSFGGVGFGGVGFGGVGFGGFSRFLSARGRESTSSGASFLMSTPRSNPLKILLDLLLPSSPRSPATSAGSEAGSSHPSPPNLHSARVTNQSLPLVSLIRTLVHHARRRHRTRLDPRTRRSTSIVSRAPAVALRTREPFKFIAPHRLQRRLRAITFASEPIASEHARAVPAHRASSVVRRSRIR